MKPLGKPLTTGAEITGVAFGSDGKSFVTHAIGKPPEFWDAATLKRVQKPVGDFQTLAPNEEMLNSPDGRSTLSWGPERVQLRDRGSDKILDGPVRHGREIVAAALGLDNSTVTTIERTPYFVRGVNASTGDEIELKWDVEELSKVATDEPGALAISPDGKSLLVAEDSKEKFAYIVDSATARCYRGERFNHKRSEPSILAAAFSHDGKHLMTGGADRTALIWSLEHFELSRGAPSFHTQFSTIRNAVGDTLTHQGRVTAVAFGPDGTSVLTGSEDRTARLWDWRTGRQIGRSLQHQDSVAAVAFSPDGRTVLTASSTVATYWDVATQRPVARFQHGADVTALTFAADGSKFATGSKDGAAHTWRVPAVPDGDAERIILWVQVHTGAEIGSDGSVREMDIATWHQRYQRLLELGGPPKLIACSLP